jgi:hypothetical protein
VYSYQSGLNIKEAAYGINGFFSLIERIFMFGGA